MSGPREWATHDLLALFPALEAGAPDAVHCSAAGDGEGMYLSQREGERRGCARIRIHVEPAEALEIRFEHSWPPEREAVHAEELDDRILRGLCEALAHGRASLRFGRIVTLSVTDYGVESTPIAFAVAASMAVQDAIRRGGWDPGPPADDAMGTFGRLAG